MARSTAICPQACRSEHSVTVRNTATASRLACWAYHFLINTAFEADDVQCLLGYQLLQLPVLFFQLAEALRIAYFQAAVLRLQRYSVCWLMPCFRHSSGVPRPASDSFNIPTICSSVYRLFFIQALLMVRVGLHYRRTLTIRGLFGRMQVSIDPLPSYVEIKVGILRARRPVDNASMN